MEESKIRTFEELEECEFKNLTYGEFVAHELDCKGHCPLYENGFCSGGVSCYGGDPIYPPCCDFDNNVVLQEVADDFYCARLKHEQYEEEKKRKRAEKEVKKQERKKKLREYKWRNWEDLDKIKVIKLKIKKVKRQIDEINNTRIFAMSINSVNKLFRQCNNGQGLQDVEIQNIDSAINLLNNKIEEYENQISEIRTIIKQKEQKFKKQLTHQEDKNIKEMK